MDGEAKMDGQSLFKSKNASATSVLVLNPAVTCQIYQIGTAGRDDSNAGAEQRRQWLKKVVGDDSFVNIRLKTRCLSI